MLLVGCTHIGPAYQAHATLKKADGTVIGSVALTQAHQKTIIPSVKIVAKIHGLRPGSKHGFHIHETGKCTPDFSAAGGHYDPGPYGKSALTNHPFHMGDLPNLIANNRGVANLAYTTNRATLSTGPLSLLNTNGSAFIVHDGPDLNTPDHPGGSRLACGVIVNGASRL